MRRQGWEQTVLVLGSSNLCQKMVDKKLAELLNQCEEQVAWHWQVYVTLVCLLAKEVKGERPISMLTMLFRIWSRTRKAFATEWCDAKTGFWDDAVRGSSPLQAALRR